MKLCEVIIKPLSAFGTPIKGDTLFGHFCWYGVKKELNELLDDYFDKPFAIFSSAFPVKRGKHQHDYFFPVPACPLHFMDREENRKNNDCFEQMKYLKNLKNKKWVRVSSENLKINPALENRFSNGELADFLGLASGKLFERVSRIHNSINRLTFSTSGRNFAPFYHENLWFAPHIELVVFVLFDEKKIDMTDVEEGMKIIGKLGFGRDASTGLGRFDVVSCSELTIPDAKDADYLYTLSPFVPKQEDGTRIWFTPFVRFGRHGSYLAVSTSPFKNPIIMADEGAIIEMEQNGRVPLFVGCALSGVSKIQPDAVAQGYSVTLPCILEGRRRK